MRKIWADILHHTICRWYGHTKPLWRRMYSQWYTGETLWSGQCERCWRVIDERRTVISKASPIKR